jgi:FkbM family methyltransferase
LKGSKLLGGAIAAAGSALVWPLPKRVAGKARAYAAEKLAASFDIETEQGPIRLVCASRMAFKAASMAFRLEPETRRWIDTHIQAGECLWDIGANIGAWSLYAARTRDAKVVAFEPSAQTFGVLYKNILVNRLDNRIDAYCIALSDATGLGSFYVHGADPGAGLNSLGSAENYRGAFREELKQATLSFRIDDFVKQPGVPPPDHIKLDVDGIEERILLGAVATLPGVKSIILEYETARHDAKDWFERICSILADAGFRMQASSPGADGVNEVFLNSGRK